MGFARQASLIIGVARAMSIATRVAKAATSSIEETGQTLTRAQRQMREMKEALDAFATSLRGSANLVTEDQANADLIQRLIDEYRNALANSKFDAGVGIGNVSRRFDQVGGRKRFKGLSIDELFRRGILK